MRIISPLNKFILILIDKWMQFPMSCYNSRKSHKFSNLYNFWGRSGCGSFYVTWMNERLQFVLLLEIFYILFFQSLLIANWTWAMTNNGGGWYKGNSWNDFFQSFFNWIFSHHHHHYYLSLWLIISRKMKINILHAINFYY